MVSRVMRVPREFDEYIEGLSRALGIPPGEIMKRLAQLRPIEVKEPFGASVDRLFDRMGIVPMQKKKKVIRKWR